MKMNQKKGNHQIRDVDKGGLRLLDEQGEGLRLCTSVGLRASRPNRPAPPPRPLSFFSARAAQKAGDARHKQLAVAA